MARDTLKAVRADMAKQQAATDKRLAEIEEMTRWCCEQPGGRRPPTTPSTPTSGGSSSSGSSSSGSSGSSSGGGSTPPETDPETNYPLGVLRNELQSVYSRRYRAPSGLTPIGVPSGATVDGLNIYWNGGGGTKNASNADYSGFDTWLNNGTFNLLGGKALNNPGGLYRFALGHINGIAGGSAAPAHAVIEDLYADMSSTGHLYGPVLITPNSSLILRRSQLDNGAHILIFSNGGDTEMEDVYLGSFASTVDPSIPDHTEQSKRGTGAAQALATHIARRVFWDCRMMAGALNTYNTATGQDYLEADAANLVAEHDDCIFAGAEGIKALAPVQIAAKDGKTADVVYRRCVFKRGGNPRTNLPADYIRPSLINGLGTGRVRISASNCLDYDTGENIDAQLVGLSLS